MSRQLWPTALALTVGTLSTLGCHAAALQPAATVADSVRGFSGEQGANGWSYGYWDRSADPDQRYDQATNFQRLEVFGSDPRHQPQPNGLPALNLGTLWALPGGLYFTALWAEGGNSNGTTESAPQAKVEHWVVRRWISTVEGRVTIRGHAAKILEWGDVESGQVHIVVDGATVFSAPTHGRSFDYSADATVHVGSRVDFLISPAPPAKGGAFGPVQFTASVQR